MLRPGSWRPELVVDDQALRLVDPVTETHVGVPGPFGRERCLVALPTNGTGPVLISPLGVVVSPTAFVSDSDDPVNLVGHRAGVWVHRILFARRTEDTRL